MPTVIKSVETRTETRVEHTCTGSVVPRYYVLSQDGSAINWGSINWKSHCCYYCGEKLPRTPSDIKEAS